MSRLPQLLQHCPAALLHALLRIAVVTMALTYAAVATWLDRLTFDVFDCGVGVAALIASFALLHVAMHETRESTSKHWFEFGIDHALPYWALWRFGAPATPLFVCAFAACMAYGYRLDWRYSLYSGALSILALASLTLLSPHWATASELVFVLGTCLLAVALGFPPLLRKLQAARQQLAGLSSTSEGQALYDLVTALPTSRLLRERLIAALRHAQRYGHGVGVLSFDVDELARVQQERGNEAGDVLLREVARRVGLNIRGSDLLARASTDKFTLIIERMGSAAACERVAETVLREVTSIPETTSDSGSVSTSVGIALYRCDPRLGTPSSSAQLNRLAAQLIAEANAAMQRAKSLGKSRWCVAGADAEQVDAFRLFGRAARSAPQ